MSSAEDPEHRRMETRDKIQSNAMSQRLWMDERFRASIGFIVSTAPARIILMVVELVK